MKFVSIQLHPIIVSNLKIKCLDWFIDHIRVWTLLWCNQWKLDIFFYAFWLQLFPNGRNNRWSSSPSYAGTFMVHCLLQIAILLSGLTYNRVARVFKFINLAIGSGSAFRNAQAYYYRNAISNKFTTMTNDIATSFNASERTIAIDTRFDSPGEKKKLSDSNVESCKNHIIHLYFKLIKDKTKK